MGNIYLTEKFDQNEILRDQNCSFLQIAKERGNKELKEKKKMQRKDFSRIKFRDRGRPCGKSSNRDGGSACAMCVLGFYWYKKKTLGELGMTSLLLLLLNNSLYRGFSTRFIQRIGVKALMLNRPVHFYNLHFRQYSRRVIHDTKKSIPNGSVHIDTTVLELQERNKDIESNCAKYYPSMTELQNNEKIEVRRISLHEFKDKFGDTDEFDESPQLVYGRIQNIRSSGKKIWFLDINDHSHIPNSKDQSSQLQIIINFKSLTNDNCNASNGLTLSEFESHMNQLRKNDYVQCYGIPKLSQSSNRTLSLSVKTLLRIVSPIQSPLPSGLSETGKRNNNRVIDYQVNGVYPLYQRATIIRLIRKFYQEINDFVEVETPLLSQKANGASARSFTVQYKDGHNLELRIAPELWLKRLIIGGMPKIFEIGKMFRNEGIDATHNPEFTMLESYQTYASMEDLIELAESLFKYLLCNIPWENATVKELEKSLESNNWHFKRIEFLPTLSKELGVSMENLDLENPLEILLSIPGSVRTKLNLQENMSSSQILDKLSGHYLEAKYCQTLHPTIIYHHPLAMSPLAKSTQSKPRITQRFEMFIKGKEYINAYEEENCPQVQLNNFLRQQQNNNNNNIHTSTTSKDTDTDINTEFLPVDYKYVEAMRSGMPPTGGLGVGIDRLCMLLMEKSRIEQVLPFGSIDDVNRQ